MTADYQKSLVVAKTRKIPKIIIKEIVPLIYLLSFKSFIGMDKNIIVLNKYFII